MSNQHPAVYALSYNDDQVEQHQQQQPDISLSMLSAYGT